MQRNTLKVAEVSVLLGLSRNATYDAIRRKEIPSIKIGRRIIIPAVAFDRMLDKPGDANKEKEQ
jgi:excisionase family DNA binding protein